MARPSVRAVFAALVLATFAAFFVAQQLKSEFPLVLRFAAVPGDISPNGDGVRDYTFVGFDLSEPAEVKFSVLDSEGNEVRTFVDDKRLAGDVRHRYRWNGRDDEGRVVPDGTYRLRLIRRDEGRVINSLKEVEVDTKPPRVRLTSASPNVIAPGAPGQGPVRIRYRGPRNESPEFRIFRTDDGPTRVVARFRGDDRKGATWHGTTRGRQAADGNYTFTVTVRDKAGNRAVAPRDIPTAASSPPRTGVAVRRLTLAGPLGVVRAGSRVGLRVGPVARPLRFSVVRLGGRRPVRRGRRAGRAFRVRIPRRARTGVYVVRVQSAGRTALWPLAVQGVRRPRRRVPLVVLPAITWQGLNRVDDDYDGFADTLETSSSVPLGRPFAGGRLPAGFRGQVAPLVRFLDSERLGYDLTTDLSLTGDSSALRGAPGVAFAGSERWSTPALGARLRAYVDGGGRVASFGADALRREVRVERGRLRDPSSRRGNLLGEATSTYRADPGPLIVADDGLGVFGGDGFIGEFSVFERSRSLAAGARALTSAGREEGETDLVAYRLGMGTVIRAGTPQWAGQLAENQAVADATVRMWRLLRRG